MTRTIASMTFAVGALLATLYFVSAVANMNVSVVRLEGELSAAEGEQVRHAVASELGKTGLRTTADVAEAVKALGWIRQVRVRRHWPDALHIDVARETLAARWGENAWLTTSGHVVPAADANAQRFANLPILRTARADAPRAMQVFNLLNESAAGAGLRLVRLEESAGGEWTVHFANEIEVMLGATDLSDRFARFIAVFHARLRDAERRLGTVDARYDPGVAVRWQDEYAAAWPPVTARPTPFGWSDDG